MTAPQTLAQASDSGAAVVALLIALGVAGLQIYLIYAIIATRQDVKLIRQSLVGGQPPSSRIPSSGPAGTGFRSEDVARLREVEDLRQTGILTDDEFARVKDSILGGWIPPASADAASPVPPPPSRGAQYSVTVTSLGSAQHGRVDRIIRSHLDYFPAERLATMPCVVAEGISFASAEPLRADLAKAGASVEMVETG